jgi:hypothetical protein
MGHLSLLSMAEYCSQPFVYTLALKSAQTQILVAHSTTTTTTRLNVIYIMIRLMHLLSLPTWTSAGASLLIFSFKPWFVLLPKEQIYLLAKKQDIITTQELVSLVRREASIYAWLEVHPENTGHGHRSTE